MTIRPLHPNRPVTWKTIREQQLTLSKTGGLEICEFTYRGGGISWFVNGGSPDFPVGFQCECASLDAAKRLYSVLNTGQYKFRDVKYY